VMLGAVACTSSEPAPSTTTEALRPQTTDPEPEPVELVLPVAPVAVTVPVPDSPNGDVIAADFDGVWLMRPMAGGWTVDRIDVSGAVSASIDLPGSAYRPVFRGGTDEVVWVPGRTDDDPSVVAFGMVRIDLVARTTQLVPTPSFVEEVQVVGDTAYAVMEPDEDTTIVQGFTATGATGPATTIRLADEGDLGALLTVTSAAVYDCLAGSWGVTPLGGDRNDVGEIGSGCNAVPIGDDVLVSGGGKLLLLGADGSTSEVDLDREVRYCNGARQSSEAEVLVLCGVQTADELVDNGQIAVRVAPGGRSATVVGELGVDPPVDFSDVIVPEQRVVGSPVGAFGERSGLDRSRSIIATEGAGGAVRWLLVDPSVGTRSLSWFGELLWTSSADGEWSRIDTS
jgi:hypothetical protein